MTGEKSVGLLMSAAYSAGFDAADELWRNQVRQVTSAARRGSSSAGAPRSSSGRLRLAAAGGELTLAGRRIVRARRAARTRARRRSHDAAS